MARINDIARGSSGMLCLETPETDVVEIPLLLPGWQATALEDAAHDRGLTTGEMLRHLLTDFFSEPRGQDSNRPVRKNRSQAAWS